MRNRYLFLSDLLLVIAAVYFSFVLRSESFDLKQFWPAFYLVTGLALVIMPLVFYQAGIYCRYWQYSSIDALFRLFWAIVIIVALTSGLGILGTIFWPERLTMPRSLPFILLLLALTFLAAPRVSLRLQAYYKSRSGQGRYNPILPVLIMGAGQAGSMIVQEIQRNPRLGMHIVGLLDDNPAKKNMIIHGVSIIGNRYDIPRLVEQHDVKQVIIAIPTAPGKVIRDILGICGRCPVHVRIIPGMFELLNGTVSVNQLRNVQIEDLLRREPIETDLTNVSNLVRGKRVLVTGGGGSIGSELCRQILKLGPAALIVLGHGENSIHEIRRKLNKSSGKPDLAGGVETYAGCRIILQIADIRDKYRMQAVFAEQRPEIVFHAAAHKHVPLMEHQPSEAVSNNVLGTRNLVAVSLANGIERFVLISSDKAVNPASIMGATKRVAELLVHRAAKVSGKPYVAVRFGNVLGSRGSVILTFKEQIAAGGPVTVTHPDMRRYFMTIPEAVQLVLQAAALGRGGEVFVLDMGKPIKIVDLATDLIKLSGLQVGQDIEIVFTGVRPGEKLSEELFGSSETCLPTTHEKIFLADNGSGGNLHGLELELKLLETAVRRNDTRVILSTLRRLVPDFRADFEPEETVPEPSPWLQAELKH